MAVGKRSPLVQRNAMIAAIHAAAKAKGLDDDTRRDMMEQVTGKRSCSQMSGSQLSAVLDHLNGKKGKPSRSAPVPSRKPDVKKIRALWLDLWMLGEIDDASEAALTAYVERMTKGARGQGGVGVASLHFLNGELSDRVIKGLRGWLKRILDADDRLEADPDQVWSQVAEKGDGYAPGLVPKLKVMWYQTKRIRILRDIQEPLNLKLLLEIEPSEIDGVLRQKAELLHLLMATQGIPVPLSKWLKSNGHKLS